MRIAPLVLLLSCATVADAQAPAKIAAVRTWGELAAQPLLTLKDGSKVRVGLEAREATRNGAFLVYALVEGKEWEASAEPSSLGPLHLEWSPDGPVSPGELRKLLDRVAGGGNGASKFLFMATVSVGMAKQVEVKFCDQTGGRVATALVLLKDAAPDFWTPLDHAEEVVKRAEEDDGAFHERNLRLKVTKLATPCCDGARPMLSRREANSKFDPSESLPLWTFERPDPRVKLRADAKRLSIESEMEMDHDDPHRQWLCRVWVNDRRVKPKDKSKEAIEQLLDRRGRERLRGKKLHIEWQFEPKDFGAKKGDRVAIQMLYCWDGWQVVPDEDRDLRVEKMRMDFFRLEPRLPLLTNKAEFVCP